MRSATGSKPPLFIIPRNAPGTLSIGPRAHGLQAWAQTLAGAGVTHVVSHLEPEEERRYGLVKEETVLTERGIDFTRLAERDFGTPDEADLVALVADLRVRLAAGEHVHVHCAGGVGRSGTTACAVLIADGFTPDQAMAAVGAARGRDVPETDDQRALLHRLAARLQDRPAEPG